MASIKRNDRDMGFSRRINGYPGAGLGLGGALVLEGRR
jgi:hypothetical protein